MEYYYANRALISEKQRLRRVQNCAARLVGEAKKRASSRGLPFDLVPSDVVIPERCPVLGIPLVVNSGKCGPDSPTLDRVIPAFGYVKGNVAVISHRANTVKSDASADELAAVLAYVKSHAWAALGVAVTAAGITPESMREAAA